MSAEEWPLLGLSDYDEEGYNKLVCRVKWLVPPGLVWWHVD
jgi:hypothetical protein